MTILGNLSNYVISFGLINEKTYFLYVDLIEKIDILVMSIVLQRITVAAHGDAYLRLKTQVE